MDCIFNEFFILLSAYFYCTWYIEKYTSKIICIIYVYLLIYHSVCWILCCPHAYHILPKFPTLHTRLNGPALGFVALWSTFMCLLSYHILIFYHVPSYFFKLKLISFLCYHCSWTAWPLNVMTLQSFKTSVTTCHNITDDRLCFVHITEHIQTLSYSATCQLSLYGPFWVQACLKELFHSSV